MPSWRNEPVQAEVRAQLQEVDGVTGVAFGPGEGAELRVFIRIDAADGRAGVARSLEGCQHVMVNPAWGDLIDTRGAVPAPRLIRDTGPRSQGRPRIRVFHCSTCP